MNNDRHLNIELSTDPITHTIILGKTKEGEIFRPSDWAERLCGNLSTFVNNRISYSPDLYPSRHEGITCIMMSKELQRSNPELYKYLLEFARKNSLMLLP